VYSAAEQDPDERKGGARTLWRFFCTNIIFRTICNFPACYAESSIDVPTRR
jgi:hypothetical protein